MGRDAAVHCFDRVGWQWLSRHVEEGIEGKVVLLKSSRRWYLAAGNTEEVARGRESSIIVLKVLIVFQRPPVAEQGKEWTGSLDSSLVILGC